jgi:ABC-type uncharacterized transport system ATPase subunit/ABC-type transport system involved in multi-copper enzyme maturation permease subunit
MSDEWVIETNNLTKRYGKFEAVSRLNLRVGAQRITGFLGRNGAGKSSTIKMLLGISRPSSGSAKMLGRSIDDIQQSSEARGRVAYVAEDKQTYAYMTVAEMIVFTRSFYDDWRSDLEQRLLKQYDLPLRRKVKALSKGMRTKLDLLLALARRPELLILDEPSEGLDPVSIEELLQSLVAAAAEGTSVFFSSHQIAEVERIADHVCIIWTARRRYIARSHRPGLSAHHTWVFQRSPARGLRGRRHRVGAYGWTPDHRPGDQERRRHCRAWIQSRSRVRGYRASESSRGFPQRRNGGRTMMLWYKAWRESRVRFMLGAALLSFLCVAFMLRARTEVPLLAAQFPKFSYSMFVWGSIYGNLNPTVFVVLAMVLGLGGLQRERASGTAAFTLALPVSRIQLVATRVGVGLLEVAALALVPVVLVPTLSPFLAGQSYPVTQALQFALLFAGWGAAAFATGFLWSTLLAGEFTAAAACIVTPVVSKVITQSNMTPPNLVALRWFPLATYDSMSGFPPYLDKNDLLVQLPWTALLVLALVAAGIFGMAARITRQQDF